jgi:thiol-disulfide isomerase/thioredoxin
VAFCKTKSKMYNYLSILLLFHCFIIETWSFGGFGSGQPLYGPEDKYIKILESGNFSQTVLNSNTAWMVEFYSSWCGHCIRFAPAYKELSQNVAGI